MKKLFLAVFTSFLFAQVGLSNTYVWEDYDDFSGSSLDTSKWGTMYFHGGVTPTIENGKMSLSSGGLNLNAQNQFKEGWEQIIATWDEQDPEVFAYLTDESVVGISAEVSLPYDSSVGAAAHLNFNNLNSENGASIEIMYDGGSTNIYLEIEGQDDAFSSISAELGRTYKFSIYYHNDSLSLLIDDQQVGSVTIPNLSPNMIGIGAYHDEGQSFDIPVDNVRVLRRSQQAEEPAPVMVVSDPNGKPVVVQVGDEYNWNDSLDGVTLWAVVDEQDGPPQIGTTTFENGNQLIAFEFLEQFDGSVTFLAPEYLSGHKGVAMQEIPGFQEIEVSRYYYLNDSQLYIEETSPELYPDYSSSLREYSFERIDNERGSLKIFSESGTNEIILTFSDWESGTWSDYSGTGDWQCYDFTHSDVPTEYQSLIEEHSLGHHQDRQQIVSHPYEIDSNGYLKVTENTSIQYYNVVSVDNGIIGTIQDDSGVDSVADNGVNQVDQWLFTTLSAAQIFYNEKIDYAPESLDGLTVKIHDLETSPGSEDYGEDTKYFVSQQVYSWEENQLESTTFSYVKNSASSATLTIHHDGGATKTIHDLTFSSENSATGTWTEAEETVTYAGTTTFTIIYEEYAPDYLNGWKLDAGASTYKLTGDSTGVFYHVDEGNYSNSELSNITYTWEKSGTGIGKLYTSLDEITWLFFEDNTTGRYHWQELEQDNNGSGYFSLNYYPDGHAHESLVGSSLKLGDTYYVFTSDTSVTVSEGSTSSIMEYAYLKNGSDNGILSIDSENRFVILDLDFSSSDYGTVVRGGNGGFRILQNWETKGWVWYGHYPWAYSHNMQDWYYQVLFINDENESDIAHYQIWDKQWKIPSELNYLGESNFSTDDAYSWEEYDEFNGSELNTSRWDIAWWDGGTAPSVDQVNNRIEFNKGSSYEAKLSDLMNVPNPNAESEYSYGYDASYGFAPSTIADMNVRIHEEQILPEYSDYGVDDIYYSDGLLFRYDNDEQQEVQEPYSYERTGPNTAKITMQSSDELYVAELTFTSENSASGTWEEQEDGVTYSGSLTFDIVFSPHSLLEFVQSDDIEGIEFELMIPNGAPDQTCIGLFAVDYNAMFNSTSDEQEEQALRFDLDLCYFDGTLTSEFNFKDQTTGEEISESQNSTLGDFQKFRFYFSDGRINFSLPGQEVKEYNFDRANETFVIRAQNEQNLDFSAYLRNVRVLRKKSYPQGWMWMDYYPWVYCHDLQSWLYFSLVKDLHGNPSLMFWDNANENWDLYYPTFSTAQAEEKEKADQLLNDN